MKSFKLIGLFLLMFTPFVLVIYTDDHRFTGVHFRVLPVCKAGQ